MLLSSLCGATTAQKEHDGGGNPLYHEGGHGLGGAHGLHHGLAPPGATDHHHSVFSPLCTARRPF